MTASPLTILCLASHEKGAAFMRALKAEGCRVLLVTREQEAHAPWPDDAIDERFLLPTLHQQRTIIHAISYLARHTRLDRIVALDDLDVETAAALREHLRLSGMGNTTARHFRDKLAMRVRARERGFRVPEFVHALNDQRLREWMAAVPGPWLLKPRSEASSVGIKRIEHADELWPALERLGDRRSYYLLEQFIHGPVFHVDGLLWEYELIFAEAHGYSAPPLAVMQQGGLFRSGTLPRDGNDSRTLRDLTARLIGGALRLRQGATHTEFIKSEEDGEFYFLETGARVGGANIAEMVEAATGINLWREWARLEVAALRGQRYELPPRHEAYAGVLISLARQEWPDLSAFQEPEIVWRLHKPYHAGLIARSTDHERVRQLLDGYTDRFIQDFHIAVPPKESLFDDDVMTR